MIRRAAQGPYSIRSSIPAIPPYHAPPREAHLSASAPLAAVGSPPPAGQAPPPPDIDATAAWPGDHAELLATLIDKFENAEESSTEERWMAERCRDYYDGRQYTDAELAILNRRRQPPSVTNYINRKVDLLLGLERRGRSDPKAYPRTDQEGTRADIATQCLRYISDDQRYDVVRSSAFENIMIEGMGGIEVIAEPNETDGGYNVVVNHIPWNRIFRDPHSMHPGFTDSTYHGFVIWMDRDDAIDMYPGVDGILTATFDSSRSNTYDDKPGRVSWSDRTRQRVRVVQIHWKKRNEWWLATLVRGGFLDPPRKSPYLDRHGRPKSPLILRSAYCDRDGRRYSPVRHMLSPQDSVNKRESKLLHMLSVNQIVFETGAVMDVDKLRAEAAKPDGMIEHNPNFKLEIQKDQAEIAGHFHLLEYSVGQMNATGPNASMAGKDPREQSGRAIIAQQSGGQMEHEPIADVLRQMSHKVYEAMWLCARQYWTEEKTIRVTDTDKKDAQFVTLNRKVTLGEELRGMDPQDAQQAARMLGLVPDDPRLGQIVRIDNSLDDLDVEITVEEGPDSPTMAAEQFAQIMQLPPQILQQFPPSLIIQASSLRDKEKLLKMLEQHQQAEAQNQQGADAMRHAVLAKTQAEAKDRDASALVRMHSIAVDHAAMPMDMAERQSGLDAAGQGMAMDQANHLADLGHKAAQVANVHAGTLRTYHDMAIEHDAAINPPEPEAPSGDQAQP